MEREYFFETESAEIAKFLDLSLPEYLKRRTDGRIPLDLARPLDPRKVLFKNSLLQWKAAGCPIAWVRPGVDPVTGKCKPSEVQNG